LPAEEISAEKAIFAEKQEQATKDFEECKTLIGKVKGAEVLLSSSEPKTLEEVDAYTKEELTRRKNIRENRLEKYLEFAELDQTFQREALELLQEVKESLKQNYQLRGLIMNCLSTIANDISQNRPETV
jgi:hypothetical protein